MLLSPSVRRIFFSWIALSSAMAVAVVVFIGCNRRNRSQISSINPTILRWPQETLPNTFEVTRCLDARCFQHAALTGEGLTRLTVEDGNVSAVAQLAKSIEPLGELGVRIQLKDAVTWSNRSPLTSVHVVNGWKHLLQSSKSQPLARFLFSIANAKEYSEGRVSFAEVGIKILNAETLIITFAERDPYFTHKLAHPVTWPRFLPAGKKMRNEDPVLGPFLREKISTDAITYLQNPNYFLGKPSITGVETRRVSSPLVRLELVMHGESDFVDDIPENVSAGLLPMGQATFESAQEVVALVFSAPRGPFSERSSRAALLELIQSKQLQTLASPLLWPTTSFLSAQTELTDKTWPTRSAPTAGKRILQNFISAGRGQFRVSLGYSKQSPLLADIAENLRAQWQSQLGIKVDLSTIETSKSQPELTLVSIPQNWILPYETLRALPTPSRLRPFEQLLDASQMSSTSERSMQFLKKAEALLNQDENLVIPLAQTAKLVFRSASLKQMQQDPLQLRSLAKARIE